MSDVEVIVVEADPEVMVAWQESAKRLDGGRPSVVIDKSVPTRQELQKLFGVSSTTMRARLRNMVDAGTCTREYGYRRDRDGRVQRVPVYRLSEGEHAKAFEHNGRKDSPVSGTTKT